MLGKISSKWLMIILVLVLALVPLLTACSDDGDDDSDGESTKEEIFKIGAFGTVYGVTAASRDQSADIAINEINEMGGITIGDTCITFDFSHEDDTGQAAGAIQAVQSLLNWGADAILNAGSIVPFEIWRPYTEQAEVITFAQTEPVHSLIGEEYPYTFHMHTDDAPAVLFLLDWVSKNRPDIKKVHGIRMQMTLYEEQSEVIEEIAFPEYGIEYTGTTLHELMEHDFYPVLTSVPLDDLDAIICDFYPFGSLSKQARELGFEGTFIVAGAIPNWVLEDAEVLERENGTISLTPDPESPLVPQYYRDYRESYYDLLGSYPFSSTAFPSYIVPYYIAAAIEEAGSTDSNKLKEVMETETLTLEFPSGETLDVTMEGKDFYGADRSWSAPQYLSVIQDGNNVVIEVITPEETNDYLEDYMKYYVSN